MCELPIGSLPTGVMRGRFHPKDRQLYTCGMFAWAGSATAPGGLYRIRATGKPMHLPIGLKAKTGEIEITWTDPLDPAAASDPKQLRHQNLGPQTHGQLRFQALQRKSPRRHRRESFQRWQNADPENPRPQTHLGHGNPLPT